MSPFKWDAPRRLNERLSEGERMSPDAARSAAGNGQCPGYRRGSRHAMNLETDTIHEATRDVHALTLGRARSGQQVFTGA